MTHNYKIKIVHNVINTHLIKQKTKTASYRGRNIEYNQKACSSFIKKIIVLALLFFTCFSFFRKLLEIHNQNSIFKLYKNAYQPGYCLTQAGIRNEEDLRNKIYSHIFLRENKNPLTIEKISNIELFERGICKIEEKNPNTQPFDINLPHASVENFIEILDQVEPHDRTSAEETMQWLKVYFKEKELSTVSSSEIMEVFAKVNDALLSPEKQKNGEAQGFRLPSASQSYIFITDQSTSLASTSVEIPTAPLSAPIELEETKDEIKNDEGTTKEIPQKNILLKELSLKRTLPIFFQILLSHFQQPDADPYQAASHIHNYILMNNPFHGANGKTARLMANWYLMHKGLSPVSFLEKGKYIRAIQDHINKEKSFSNYLKTQSSAPREQKFAERVEKECELRLKRCKVSDFTECNFVIKI